MEIRTLGLHQPFAGLMAIGAKTIETRWIRQGRKPPFPPGEYLIYATKNAYSLPELSQITKDNYSRIRGIVDNFQKGSPERNAMTAQGMALCVGTLIKHIYVLPENKDMEEKTFVHYNGPVKYFDKHNKPVTKYLAGLVFENIRIIEPFDFIGKQGVGFLSDQDRHKIKFL